ncbi:MAG: hypothetical protein LC790_18900, partial [Actinobacteria bacterium]|nr:hypothetical protein [Actinomycetota bacterium]
SDRVRVSRERLANGDVEELGELPVIVLPAGSTESPLSVAAMRSDGNGSIAPCRMGLAVRALTPADWRLV